MRWADRFPIPRGGYAHRTDATRERRRRLDCEALLDIAMMHVPMERSSLRQAYENYKETYDADRG